MLVVPLTRVGICLKQNTITMLNKLYCNITINVDESVLKQWNSTVKYEIIPELILKEYITEVKIMEIMVQEQLGGRSFAMMIKTDASKTPEFLNKNIVVEFNSTLRQKFQDKVLTFTTFLNEVFVAN